MKHLPTALLQHTLRDGCHYDWLIADPRRPGDADAMLCAARCPCPTARWRAAGSWLITVLPPHRRAYLTWQGPVSGDRGTVRRIDQGHAVVHRWAASVCIVDVTMARFAGRITLTRLNRSTWRAAVTARG